MIALAGANRDDTTCLIYAFYLVARSVGEGRARRGYSARGIVALLDPTASYSHRVFAGERGAGERV